MKSKDLIYNNYYKIQNPAYTYYFKFKGLNNNNLLINGYYIQNGYYYDNKKILGITTEIDKNHNIITNIFLEEILNILPENNIDKKIFYRNNKIQHLLKL